MPFLLAAAVGWPPRYPVAMATPEAEEKSRACSVVVVVVVGV